MCSTQFPGSGVSCTFDTQLLQHHRLSNHCYQGKVRNAWLDRASRWTADIKFCAQLF